MKKLTFILAIAFIASFTAAISQPGNERCIQGKHSRMGRIPGYNFYENNKTDLNLNVEQLKKLKEIDDSFQKERIDLRAKAKHAGLEMKIEMKKTDINSDAVFTKQESIQEARNNMQKRTLAYKLGLYNVLTSEQKTKIADIKSRYMKDGMGMNKPGRGQCNGTGRGFGGRGQCQGMRNE